MKDSPLVLVSEVHILIGSGGVMDMCDDRPNKAGDEQISSSSAGRIGVPFCSGALLHFMAKQG